MNMLPETTGGCHGFATTLEAVCLGREVAPSDLEELSLHLLQCTKCRADLNEVGLEAVFGGVSQGIRGMWGVSTEQ